MKKLISILAVLVLIALGAWWFLVRGTKQNSGPKEQPLAVKIHSPAFNQSVDSMVSAYIELKNAFVDADTMLAKTACKKFIRLTDSLPVDELKKDTTGIYEGASMQLKDIKANAESLLTQKDLTEMRQDFRMVSESIYPLLKTIHYEGGKLYWQNCPMAFGEGKDASWISNTEEIVNPYLGKNHPEYKATMLHCGEVKDSIIAGK